MSRARLSIGAMVALSWGLASAPVSAWTSIAGSQPTWPGSVPYSLHQAGSADLGGFATTEAVVRDGMEDWTRVSCTDLTTTYRGSTANQPFQSGTAVIGWYETTWPESPTAIGVTGPSWNGAGDIVDAHMMMNGVNFTWTNDSGTGGRVNAYSIVLHEGGHYYGLGHSGDRGATMYPAYSGGLLALNADDTAGICTLYPGDGGGALDCTTTGCPAGETCVGGACVPAGGVGDMCDSCTSDTQCPGLCLRYPDGRGYCGTPCSTDADCGSDVCGRTTDGRQQCVRLSGGAPDCSATVPEPAPPPDPEPTPECAVAADCGVGSRCDGGVCVADGGGALGDRCLDNSECDSNICAIDSTAGESFCTTLCELSEACPAGFGCVEGLCRAGAGGGLGDACRENTDCASGICAIGVAVPFCTRTCTTAESCSGFDCVPTEDGAVRVCAPPEGYVPPSPGRVDDVRVLRGQACSATPGVARASPASLVVVLLVLAELRRRRRRRRR